MPYPEAIFDLSYFKRTPSPFYTLARDLFPGQKYRPTVSHFFIKLLHEKGLLLRHYTQNIDGLEREAGMSSDLIVEAHGSFWTGTCFGRTKENDDGGGTEEDGDDTTGWTVLSSDSDDEQSDDQEETEGSSKSKKKKLRFRLGCGRKYSQSWLRSRLFAPSTESVNHPTCDSCGCLVKPDITFFGESLPHRFHSLSSQDFGKCDLLLVMGTSLTVHPFASLIGAVNESVPRLLMNRERAGESGFKNGFQFISNSLSTRSGAAKPTRDKLFLGSVDDGCIELTRLLGWTSDLERLMCASQ